MKQWKLYCLGLAPLALLASTAMGQGLPAITPPPGLAIAPQPAPVNAPAPPAALPPNIWDQITPRADQCAACKAKICNSRIGQLLNNMLAPVGAMSGGLLGPCCPTINAADLAKPPDSAEGAAARLKMDEADAAARREAVRYMAGADCHYWPEVTEALIGALRADRNECVRLEAALALGRGCCCNRATMKALTLTVSGSTEDGNPPEDSERVKAAALAALNHCLANYTEVVPAPEAPIHHDGEPIPPKGEPVPPPKPTETVPPPAPGAPMTQKRPLGPTEFYHHAENLQEKKVVAEARRAVEHVTPVAVGAPSPAADHTLFGIVRAAVTPPPGSVVPAVVVMDRPTTPFTVVPAVMVQPVKAPPPAGVPAAPHPSGVAPAGYFPFPVKTAAPAEKAATPVEKTGAPSDKTPPVVKTAVPVAKATPPAEKTHPVEKTAVRAETPPPPPVFVAPAVAAKPVSAEKTASAEKATVQGDKAPAAAANVVAVATLAPPPAFVAPAAAVKPVPAEKAASAEKPTAQGDKAPTSAATAVAAANWVSPPAFVAPAAAVKPVPVVTLTPRPTVVAPIAPAKAAPAPQADASAAVVAEAISVLRDSFQPEERARAAEALGACDGWASPHVVQALIEAARTDADPPVRAACLRSLSRMNVRTMPVATVAETLRTDPDPRVRTEAEQVLKQIGQPSRSQ